MGSCSSKSGCSTCGTANQCKPDEKQAHSDAVLKARMGLIKKKIMIMSGKGGVGKSTVTANLGAALALSGLKVGIMDADIHGPNIPKMFGVDKEKLSGDDNGITPVPAMENLSIMSVAFALPDEDKAVIWRASLKHSLIQQFAGDVNWGELDVLLIDLPPGTGDEPLSVAHILKDVDGVVIVTTPQEVALLDSRKSVTFCHQMKLPLLGIVENMSGMICPHCNGTIDLFKKGGGQKAAEEMNVPFLGAVPIDPVVVIQGDVGKPYVAMFPDRDGAKVFFGIAERIKDMI